MSKMAMDIFIKQELERRKNQYTFEQELKVYALTWNING
jgi:hypothetical protein